MKDRWCWIGLVSTALVLILLAGCAPAAAPAQPAAPAAPAQSSEAKPNTVAPVPAPAEPTRAPAALATAVPLPTQPLPQPTQPLPQPTRVTQPEPAPVAQPTPTLAIEGRLVELEWPGHLRLGDSEVVRLALAPSKDGYKVEAEFSEHQLQTQTVPVERPEGYQLYAEALLDGVAFEISPNAGQEYLLPVGQTVTWRWTVRPQTSGQHGLTIALWLRWRPEPGVAGPEREVLAFSRGLAVQVTSFAGLTRAQAMSTGFVGLLFGGVLGLFALVARPRPARPAWLETRAPNPQLEIELPPGMALRGEESELLRALFNRYARLVLQSEFLSGYSGARTFLVLPVRPDGRADAHTIVKIGPAGTIRREFENYESYVKDSLPPITARIQHAPVSVRGGHKAGLQYTFIAEPGRQPISLRQALLKEADPSLLYKLFETFGPNWWMQRQPYVFRAAQEYDLLLLPHYMLEPLAGRAPAEQPIDEHTPPGRLNLHPGQVVLVRRFALGELRADGRSLTLRGVAVPGEAALRLRWLGERAPENTLARVVADRGMLMAQLVSGFERFGYPDPLARLPEWLGQTVMGTRSIIHGDLNLENVLVGPGNFVWLIDFAQTRLGHPLYDFARLKAELIAQVLAARVETPAQFAELLRTGDPRVGDLALLAAVDEIAGRCLFNPHERREAALANVLACLGALKFGNLEEKSRRCLYVAAACFGDGL